jgi:hypothetical protein
MSPKIISQQSAYNEGLKFFLPGAPVLAVISPNGMSRTANAENVNRKTTGDAISGRKTEENRCSSSGPRALIAFGEDRWVDRSRGCG